MYDEGTSITCAWWSSGFMHKIRSKRKRKRERAVLAENLESPFPWWQSSWLTCWMAGSGCFFGLLLSPGAKGAPQPSPYQLTAKTSVPSFGEWILSRRKQSGEEENTVQESIANSDPNPFSFSWFCHTMGRQYFSVHTPLSCCDWVWNVLDKSPCICILLGFHTDVTFPTLSILKTREKLGPISIKAEVRKV